ncbi:sentrin-specific protease 7-like [Thalassophryne amazonica]|uniref:sentrin-specific protease 7-like n=1 Tax=Thalassophryne amazonica TaxID=390379 RepID=UPI00147117FD|nr:sentrin-specific protease 7-like [Thalassophryne amazonica]
MSTFKIPKRKRPADDDVAYVHRSPLSLSSSAADFQKMRKHTETSSKSEKSTVDSIDLQQLPSRLIQYPARPCKGSITVTKDDLACLDDGVYLNDVIVDFYLKYLLEGVGGAVAERSHVFSSFFYNQLSRRQNASEDAANFVSDRHMRHQRVKRWTRNVDIFKKDFLFVPVNQSSHWFLVVVCFPGLEEVQSEVRHRPAVGTLTAALQKLSEETTSGFHRKCYCDAGAERTGEKGAVTPTSQQPPI